MSQEMDDRRRSWGKRYRIRIAASLVVAAILLVMHYRAPNYRTIQLPSGETFDIITLSDARGAVPGVSTTAPSQFLFVDYYGRGDTERQLLIEHSKLLTVFGPVASERNDTLLVIQSTLPIGPRFTGLMRGFVATYRRDSTGHFQPI